MAVPQHRIGIDHPTVVPATPPTDEESTTDGEQSSTERRGRNA